MTIRNVATSAFPDAPLTSAPATSSLPTAVAAPSPATAAFVLPRSALVCALMTAVMWWLPGQRSGLFALGWIALAPLFWTLNDLRAGKRFWCGWRVGWLCYTLINWWIIPTIARASPIIGVPVPLGAVLGFLAVGLIALVHGFLVALVSCAWNTQSQLARRAPWMLPIIVAILWALLDAARYETILAHGWGALAYTQWRDAALLQSAPLIGQHGLSALCVWFAASLALWMRRHDAILWRAPVAVFLGLHLYGAWRLHQADTLRAAAGPAHSGMRVLLVQTSISSWHSGETTGESPINRAARLTHDAFIKAGGVPGTFDLIVWPETSVTALRPGASGPNARRTGNDISLLNALARETGTPILAGTETRIQSSETLNEALLIAPDGAQQATTKQHLVPFGERAPFGDYLPFLNQLARPNPVAFGGPTKMLRLTTARGATIPIGGVICFESCFRYPAHQLAREGAKALFVLTNDEWFTGTNAPWDHAVESTIRAAENGVPVAQAANAGYTFVVDAQGRFVPNEAGEIMPAFGKESAVVVTMPE